MLKWKKNKSGDVVTEQLTDSTSEGSFGEIDLTWVGRISGLDEALELARQIQQLGADGLGTTAGAGGSSAATASSPDLDLTSAGSFGSVGAAVFMTAQIQPTGTGVFDTFVQIHANGQEHGYNTDHRPQQFNEKNSANHNRSLLLSNVAIVIGDGSNGTNEGTAYREFILDANEAGGAKQFLSLDRLQIFQESSGDLTGFTPGVGFGAPGEHLVYDLDADADRWIALNAGLSSGSGQSDMRLLIPNALFDQSLAYVVVYSGLGFQGGGWASDGGFEEWGTDSANSPGGGGAFAFNITKTATVPGGTADAAGELITYAIRLINTGVADLTGVTVTDPFVSNLARGADIVGNNDNVLNVGEIWSYSADHTVTQNEIDTVDTVDNTATADSDQTGPDSASTTIAVDHRPSASLTKNAAIVGGAVTAAGDVIHYRLIATNDGNMTLTDPTVADPQSTLSTPVDGAPVVNPDAQIFIPVLDGDYNAGDTDNDGIDEPTDHNGAEDPGETFQRVYLGDTNFDGRHDPGETWAAFNLGDADNDGFRDPGETFAGDANNNGIEDNGELWQFKNLGDTNTNGLQDNGETWQYANAGDDNQNGVEDNGETFLYHNIGNTNQNGTEDPGETFQYYNAGDTNQNGIEDDGETFQFIVTNTVTAVDVNNDGFNDGDTDFDGKLSVGESWKYTATYTATQDDIDNRDSNGIPTVEPGLTHDNTATLTAHLVSDSASAAVPIAQDPQLAVTKTVTSITSTDEAEGTTTVDAAGDIINYEVTVENTGNMTLTGLDVGDSLAADLAYASGDGNNDGELDVDETWTYVGSYTVLQSDIDDHGSIDGTADDSLRNDATAETDQDAGGTAFAAVPIDYLPSVDLSKEASVPGGTANEAGELISYAISVENTGNVTLTTPVVSDDFASNLAGLDVDEDTFNDGDINLDGELDVGEIWQYTANHVVTQEEIDAGGTIDNTASVSTDQGVTDEDSASVPIGPVLALDKSSSPLIDGDESGDPSVDDPIQYFFSLVNNGSVALHDVMLDDTLFGMVAFTPDSPDANGLLDPGETWLMSDTYLITQDDVDAGFVDNDATATGLNPANVLVTSNTAHWHLEF